jgi:MarR family transcriptional regulator for hemolysin
VIDQLIVSGLVERREDESDRRARTLHLTERGRDCAARLEQALVPFRRTLFDGIPRNEIAACASVLSRLEAAISAYEDAAGSRRAS